MDIQIGSRVELRKESEFWGQSKGSLGTVGSEGILNERGQWYHVEWDSNYDNQYRAEDLKLLKPNKIKWL